MSEQVDGLLFDIDGTMANTDPTHFTVFRELLAKEAGVNGGAPIDEAFYRRFISGRTNALIMADLFPDWPLDQQRAWSDAKEARFRETAAAGLLASKTPGLDRLLRWVEVQRPGKACAVTNAPRPNADAILRGLGLDAWFGDRIIIGEECERAKPDPLPYVLGAERIGADPKRCVVFEDSPSGATAGKAAGCFVVGILSGQTHEALEAVGCDLIVSDFEDRALWEILE